VHRQQGEISFRLDLAHQRQNGARPQQMDPISSDKNIPTNTAVSAKKKY